MPEVDMTTRTAIGQVEQRLEQAHSKSLTQIAWESFRKHQLAMFGLIVLGVLYVGSLMASFIAPYGMAEYSTTNITRDQPPTKVYFSDPETGALSWPFVYTVKSELNQTTFETDYTEDRSQKYPIRLLVNRTEEAGQYRLFGLIPMSLKLFWVDDPARIYLLGSDNYGRDIFSRIWYGAQISLSIGLIANVGAFALGLIFGGIAGYFAGRPVSINFWAILRGFGIFSTEHLKKRTFLKWLTALPLWLILIAFWPLMLIGSLLWINDISRISTDITWILNVVWFFWGLWVVLVVYVGFISKNIDLDNVIMRFTEMISAIPTLILLTTLIALLPKDLNPIVVFYGVVAALSLVGWGDLARVVRSQILSIREQDYAQAALALGASEARVIFRHIVPSTFSYLIVSASLAIPGYILTESALSFIGYGIREPQASWGLMLQTAQEAGFAALALRPWLLIPGFFIVLAVFCWNFLGDGMRDAFDPRKRQ
jgi:peptide/nickel transport system permease protein